MPCLKRTWQHLLGLQICKWTNPKVFCNNVLWRDKTTVEMFGQNTVPENQTQHISTNTSNQLSNLVMEGWWCGLESLSRAWPPLYMKVLPRLGHATVQWSRAHQSSQNLQHNVWKRKNQCVLMNQSCHKLMSANLNQLKQLCKEEWNKYSTTMCPTH